MSLINNAHPGSQINLACVIFRVLNRAGGSKPEEELVNLCRPESFPTKQDHIKRLPGEINFWCHPNHQVWKKDSDNNLALVRNQTLVDDPSPKDIAECFLQAVFESPLQSVVGEDDCDGLATLFRTLACLLALKDYVPPFGQPIDNPELRARLEIELPNRFMLNDSELATFLEHGAFLGFFGQVKGGYVVDPTDVVEWGLKQFMSECHPVVATEVVDNLANILPVFDRGKYRCEVESVMGSEAIGNDFRLSPSLSHALERLRLKGVLSIETKSDSVQALTLQIPQGDRQVSEITLLPIEN